MINAYDNHGQTPLHIAIVQQHQEIADLLIAAGADPTLPMELCMVPDCNNECRVPHDCDKVHPRE